MSRSRMISIQGPRPYVSQISAENKKIQEDLKRFLEEIGTNAEELMNNSTMKALIRRTLLEDLTTPTKDPRVSFNVVHMLSARSLGNSNLQSTSFSSSFATKKLICGSFLRERVFDLGRHNKVFCSQWLNDRQVVLGTKCNSLIILDVKTGRTFKMPCLPSSGRFKPSEDSGGIRGIEINPSRTFLATGGDKTNELAIYSMPSFDPVCVGEGCHTDWIFDLKWLDDQFLVTGSRDGSIGLWKLDSETINEGIKYRQEETENSSDSSDSHSSNDLTGFQDMTYVSHLERVTCKEGKKVRSILFNEQEGDIVALTLNSRINVFDAHSMTQKSSTVIPHQGRSNQGDNLCLAHYPDGKLYAVGSKTHVDLIDYRTSYSNSKRISFPLPSIGVRSLSCTGDILTFATGCGSVFFYDLKAEKILETDQRSDHGKDMKSQPVVVSTSKGFVERDDEYYAYYINNMEYLPAIYTHCYDSSGTRLFVAGGPLSASLAGNYAGLWS